MLTKRKIITLLFTLTFGTSSLLFNFKAVQAAQDDSSKKIESFMKQHYQMKRLQKIKMV